MTKSNIDPREIPLRVVGMRYYEAIGEKNRLYTRLFNEASSYIKELYDGEVEDVTLSIKFSGPNTVLIMFADKENNSHRIEIPLWGE
jgi:hypothetical protein